MHNILKKILFQAHKQLFSEKGKIEKIIEIEEKNVSKSKDGTEEKVERTLYKRPSKHLKVS